MYEIIQNITKNVSTGRRFIQITVVILLISQFKMPVVMNEHIKVLSCNMRHVTKPKFQKTILLIKNPLSQSCTELSI